MSTTILKWWCVIAACSFASQHVSDAHELCVVDFLFPSTARSETYQTCKLYEGEGTCLDADGEAAGPKADIDALELPAGACRDQFMSPMICSILDGWSAHLFDGEQGAVRSLPFLCAEFAAGLYGACSSANMKKNPFLVTSLVSSQAIPKDGTIASEYPTSSSFVAAFAVGEDRYCFSGTPYVAPIPKPVERTTDICVEMLTDLKMTTDANFNGVNKDEVWLTFVPVPGLPGVIALGSHNGHMETHRINDFGKLPTKLSTIHSLGSKATNPGKPSNEQGMLGMAFHKNYQQNGRVFVSYTCGDTAYCGESAGTVIEEYRVKDPTNPSKLIFDTETPKNIIFTTTQPLGNHNGGQILFSPDERDAHLYIMLGDGGGAGDRENNAQNTKTFLGKILRIDIDSAPLSGLNYAIPNDNPFVNNPNVLPEIWALGVRNPWRCSFDSANPSYLFCGDVGQGEVEEVSLIIKGGNYGWRKYEGNTEYSAGTSLAAEQNEHIPPIAIYTHTEIKAGGGGSITGGFIYRSAVDPRLRGRYIFADLYDRIFEITESPLGSGSFTKPQLIEPLCSRESPIACTSGQRYIMTFGQDHFGNIYFVSQKGLHRIVPPCLCSEEAEACVDVEMSIDQKDLTEATKAPGTDPPGTMPPSTAAAGSSLAVLSGVVFALAWVWVVDA